MITFEGKNKKEAIKKASLELNKSESEIEKTSTVVYEKKTLFSSLVRIGIFDYSEVYDYCVKYLDLLVSFLHISASYRMEYDEPTKVITIVIVSEQGSALIGKNGVNLNALNILVRSALFNKFGSTYKVLLDCNNYKEEKYEKIRKLARKNVQDVLASHIPAILPPMTADERRVVHDEIKGFNNIRADSTGIGLDRHIVITYEPGNATIFGSKDNSK